MATDASAARTWRSGDVLAWLRDRRVTLSLAGSLLVWFQVQRGVAAVVAPEIYQYLFTVGSVGTPTPGWAFAGVSHLTRRHLLNNVAVLLTFGAVVEPHLRPRAYLALFFGAGAASAVGQGVVYALTAQSGPVMGASGGVLALSTYLSWHYFRDHADETRVDARGVDRDLAFPAAVLGFVYPLVIVVAGLFPWLVVAPRAATAGHAIGASLGVASVYLVAAAPGARCQRQVE